MASSTLAIPILYHKPTPSIRKSKLEATKVRSEDELLKFFLHGSYDVQRGNVHVAQVEQSTDKTICIKEETKTISSTVTDDSKSKSRCMFEETFMINISVKQPDATAAVPKQIDVRIEKTPSDPQIANEKVDVDEISSIFDEDEHEEVESVLFNEINSSVSEAPPTNLTLADMINKSLTTIPTRSTENLNKTQNWYVEKKDESKLRKSTEDISGTKVTEKVIKTPSPSSVISSALRPTALTTNINEDKKLFEYLDYLDNKGESKQSASACNLSTTTKSPKSDSPVQKPPPKTTQQQQQQQQQQQPQQQKPQPQSHEPISIIDLEQLCRSLNVNDLKDELIRRKIYELKVLIDERHKKQKLQTPIVAPRKDNLPVLIAMPPAVQQRRKTTVVPPISLIKSETVDIQVPYESSYHDIIANYNNKQTSSPPTHKQQYTRQQTAVLNANRKYQHT